MTIKPISRKSVLVTDGNHRATLAVVRSLGRAGIPVTVGDSGGSAVAARSRYCSSRVLYPSPLKSPADFQSFIREQAGTGQYSLLLPMTDITLQCMAEDSALRDCVALPFPQLEQVKIAQDKAHTLALAASLGI